MNVLMRDCLWRKSEPNSVVEIGPAKFKTASRSAMFSAAIHSGRWMWMRDVQWGTTKVPAWSARGRCRGRHLPEFGRSATLFARRHYLQKLASGFAKV
jgi:hypothetical protein